jgi:toxin-antitoxin system PIN domain toxin
VISLDSNLLLYAYALNLPEHARAREFVESLAAREDVAISEFVLVEFYRLLRLPVLHAHPLSAAQAARVIQTYRRHPRWSVVGFPEGNSSGIHAELWRLAAHPGFAYRRIFDARLALVLRHHGITDFATANVKDFEGFGFARVWNPLEAQS